MCTVQQIPINRFLLFYYYHLFIIYIDFLSVCIRIESNPHIKCNKKNDNFRSRYGFWLLAVVWFENHNFLIGGLSIYTRYSFLFRYFSFPTFYMLERDFSGGGKRRRRRRNSLHYLLTFEKNIAYRICNKTSSVATKRCYRNII